MNFIKNIIKKFILFLIGYDFFEKKLILEGVRLSNTQKKQLNIKNLKDVEFSVFSQWGDDGIINWIINNIPIKDKIFLEIGTENYKESNTRFLLIKNNWTGHIIEIDKKHTDNIKKQSIYWKYDLNVHNHKVTRENINNIIKNINLKNIGLFSLDIDGIDYWIWREIKKLNPVIFICEFNSVFGNKKKITVPYDKNFNRTKFHYSNLAFGASIQAFIKVSQKKGYEFIGTNSNGVNAYFIKKNHYKFIKSKIKHRGIFTSKTRESRDRNYNKTFLKDDKRLKKIKNVKVYDIEKNKLIKIKDIT
tara:strand:- start:287 stop:1198 length:912 start_codon:yes stop_codon:yes gene_type:complete